MLASVPLAAAFLLGPAATPTSPAPPSSHPLQQAREVPSQDALVQAVERADLERVRAILKDGVDPKPAVEPGRSAPDSTSSLCLAVSYNELAIARVLLESGQPVNAKDEAGAAPIHFVRSPEMAALLVNAGADLDAVDADGAGALEHLCPSPYWQSWWTRTGMARATAAALIEAGLSVTLTDAIRLGLPDEVEGLLDGAAPPTTTDLYHAISSDAGTEETLRILRALLSRGARFDGLPPERHIQGWSFARTMVTWTVYRGRFDVACFLLEAGAVPPEPSEWGWEFIKGSTIHESEQGDLLDRAIEEGHGRLAKLLLGRGYPPTHCGPRMFLDQQHRAARVCRAAWRGHGEIALELLRAGASAGAVYGDCNPALTAAAAGHPQLHDRLIAAGVAPSVHAAAYLGRGAGLDALLTPETLNRCDGRMGCSPIAWAILGGRPGAVRRLIQAGADLKIGVPEGASRLESSQGLHGSLMPRLIDSEHPRTISLPALAATSGHWTIVSALMDAGAPADRSLITALATSPTPRATEWLGRAIALPGRDQDPGWSDEALRRLMKTGHYWELDRVPLDARMARVNQLLRAGAPANLANGNSLIDQVAHSPVMPVVSALLAHGGTVSAETALILGLDGHGATDEYLRALGPKARDHMLWRAICAGGTAAVVRLLDTAGESRAQHAQYVCDHAPWHDPGAIAALTSAGVIPSEGQEATFRRAWQQIRNPAVLREYLASGVSTEELERPDRTWLHEACRTQSAGSIQLLLEAGLDPNRRTSDGRTTFEVLFSRPSNSPELLECVRILLEAGADPLRVTFWNRANFRLSRSPDRTDAMVAAIEDLMRPYAAPYL